MPESTLQPLSEEQRNQADALGAALVNARRELIHAQHLADSLGAMQCHMLGNTAIAAVDDATHLVQELLGGVR